MKRIDLTGQRFGRLTVVSYAFTRKTDVMWNCVCDCGKHTIVSRSDLKKGKSKSCGCYRIERSKEANKGAKHGLTHGLSNTRIYHIWRGIKDRCFNEKKDRYKNYGGRGITICDEWRNDFQAFYNWAMLHGYSENLTIDRIDVNGNYEPSNCRWITKGEQANNTRNNHLITYCGETKTIAQWAKKIGIKYSTLSARINSYGWSIEKALTEKIHK